MVQQDLFFQEAKEEKEGKNNRLVTLEHSAFVKMLKLFQHGENLAENEVIAVRTAWIIALSILWNGSSSCLILGSVYKREIWIDVLNIGPT